MSFFFKELINSQRFLDIAAVTRGCYRVFSGINPSQVYLDFLDMDPSLNKPKNNSQNINISLENNKKSDEKIVNESKVQEKKQENIVQSNKIIDEKKLVSLIVNEKTQEELKEKKIPSSSLARAWSFGTLGISVIGGGVSEAIKQNLGLSKKSDGSGFKKYLLTEANAERISNALCKMRGAPLKLGQILSIQEDDLIPKPIREAFEKARKNANVMPRKQVHAMLTQELGGDWRTKFKEFNEMPFAAASIGQVHSAITLEGEEVAVKIQYPGVRESVDSDLENLKRLMVWANVFPKSLFLDQLIAYTRKELLEECDYIAEALKQEKYRDFVAGRKDVYVPKIIKKLSTSRILTAELIKGVSIDYIALNFSQEVRDEIGKRVMSLTLEELFKFNFMQTDPNPANFFYDSSKDILYLLDFGATREFPQLFLNQYIEIIKAAIEKNGNIIKELSKSIGFLTGDENKIMINAHEESILTVGEPFAYQGKFDFGGQKMTEKIYKLMPVMFRNRLKAPPPEVYSLHRKLSGAFLINMKLKSKVNCNKLFLEVYSNFKRQ